MKKITFFVILCCCVCFFEGCEKENSHPDGELYYNPISQNIISHNIEKKTVQASVWEKFSVLAV